MASQGFLPFQYQNERKSGGLTGLAGLPAFFELARVWESLRWNLCARPGDQGGSDPWVMLSLVLLNLAGGICIDDIDTLASWGRTVGVGPVPRRLWKQTRHGW